MKSTFIAVLGFILIQSHCLLGEETRSVTELLKALEVEKTQFGAILELEEHGIDAVPAVPRLIRLLDARNDRTRQAAADALGAIGKDATAAIPKLVERIGEGEWPRFSTETFMGNVGVNSALALGNMGKEAVGPLERRLADKSPAVRSNAAIALGAIGPDARSATPALIRLLKDRDALVRECVIWAIKDIGTDPDQTIPTLTEMLSDRNFNIRGAAVNALGSIRPTTPAVVETLISSLGDKEGDVQHEAADALGKFGADALPAIPALIETLKSRKAYRYGHPVTYRPVARTAARALGTLGPRAKTAMPALLDLVRNSKRTFYGHALDDQRVNSEARAEAAIAAARIDPHSDELVRVLSRSLVEDEWDGWIRGDVAVALALIGPKAKSTLPLLKRLIESDSLDALNFACVIVMIDPNDSAAMQTLLENLPPTYSFDGDDEWDMLRAALLKAGARSRPAIPILIETVKDISKDQENAARTLAIFGPNAKSAIPALLNLLAETYYWDRLRKEAVAALQKIASERSPPLLASLKNPNTLLRCGAVEVLGGFSGAAPLLIEALDDPSNRVRHAALLSLAKLDGSAESAIPHVRKLLKSDSPTIRAAAAITLNKLNSQ